MLREAVDARLVSRPQRERHGARLERREPVRERARGGAHEAAGGEDVERAIRARPRGAAAARARTRSVTPRLGKQRDVPAAEEPRLPLPPRRGRLRPRAGGRAAAAELLVERGEEEREHRLGDARRASGAPARSDWNRSCRRSSSTNAASGVSVDVLVAWSMQFGGDRPRGVIVLARFRPAASAAAVARRVHSRVRPRVPAPTALSAELLSAQPARPTAPRGTPGALMSR